jgi:glycosyltransferase involved in cell wall biosynthesis
MGMKLSVIVPVYNEAESLPLLMRALRDAIDPLKIRWEVIFVDDGSKDNSAAVLETLAAADLANIRVIVLRRNFGQTTAIAAGIDYAQGEIIVLIDADLQNDPADIPMLLAKIDEGYDVVSGWRANRQDAFLTRTLPSRMANNLISWVTGVHLHDYGCTLKAYRREVITGFHLYGEMHRFIPVYANSVGARLVEVKVNHHPRRYGKAKYGLERTLKVMLDLFTVKFLNSYGSKPIYLFGGTFFLVSVTTSPLFLISVVVALMGFQSILMGLIAEMLMRTYHESQGKPTYTVRETFNIMVVPIAHSSIES